MKAFQERVVKEKEELDDKIGKLQHFLNDNSTYAGLPEAEQLRMSEQLSAMTRYSEILGERIKNFT